MKKEEEYADPTKPMIELIKDYLPDFAEEDENFKTKFSMTNEVEKELENYINETARKYLSEKKGNAIISSLVFKWSVDFFNDDILAKKLEEKKQKEEENKKRQEKWEMEKKEREEKQKIEKTEKAKKEIVNDENSLFFGMEF